MKFKVEVFILVAWLLCDIASTLFLSHLSEVKQENETLSVICIDKYYGNPTTWRGPKNRLLGERTNPQARMTSYGTQLFFQKIRKEDNGTYNCKTEKENAEFTLFVEDPIEFVDTPSQQFGREGANIFLKCEARGGVINWSIDGEAPSGQRYKIMGDGLLIENATKEDSRTYICRVVNEEAGTMKDMPIELKVRHEPRLPSNTTEKHYLKQVIVYGDIGGVVNLTCEVEAEPPPIFTWYDKSHRKKISEGIFIAPFQSVLMFKMTQKNMGDYKCIAENEYGRLEVQFTLLKGTHPQPPTSLALIKATSDTLVLEIDGPEPTEDEKPNMVPIGYRVDYRTVQENETEWMALSFPLVDDKMYTLEELVQTTQYQVKVATENRAGYSIFTNSTIFATEPNAANTLNFTLPSIASIVVSILLIIFNGLLNNHI